MTYTRPFWYGLFRINILKVRFWEGGGGHKKEYAVYARENDDNYGRPLMLIYSIMMQFKLDALDDIG